MNIAYNDEDISKNNKKLKQFLEYVNLNPDEFLERTKANPKATERLIMPYIQKRKSNDHVSGSTIRCLRDALKLFFEMNDLENGINWNKILKIMPHAKKVGSDRAPSIDEIRAIISNWDLRFNVIVLMQCSGGFRLGAFGFLTVLISHFSTCFFPT
ncbi:MAG: hypothetical protein QW830_05910 [Nitrososphaerales archaeon]